MFAGRVEKGLYQKKKKKKGKTQIPLCSITFTPPGLPAVSVRPQGSTTEISELPEPQYSSPALQAAAEGDEIDVLPVNVCSIWQSHISQL